MGLMRFLTILIMVWSTAHYIVYKYNTTVKMFKYMEDESKKGAIFSIILLYISIISITCYKYFFCM